MAYASWSVVFGEQPTASKWNILGTNDASFNDGTGIFGLYKNLLAVDSNPYKFSASGSADASLGNNAKVRCNTEQYDTNSNYDNATNYRYVAPVNGFYHFDGHLAMLVTNNSIFDCALYKNGSIYKKGSTAFQITGGAQTISSVASSDIQLTATDYIELYVVNSSGTFTVVTTGFTGHLISRT